MGVDIPGKKRVEYSLRYIHGIGPTRARDIVAQAHIDPLKKADNLTDDEVTRIAACCKPTRWKAICAARCRVTFGG